MVRIRGSGNHKGAVMARAAVVKYVGGSPVLPDWLRVLLEDTERRRRFDADDLIIVGGGDVIEALNLETVTVAAWVLSSPPASEAALPCVTVIPEDLKKVVDGELVIVDSVTGYVISDPEPGAISAYQAIVERLQARIRFHLEEEHLPAVTAHGRKVRVLALAETAAEIDEAVQNGADGLVVELTRVATAANPAGTELFSLLRERIINSAKPTTLLHPFVHLDAEDVLVLAGQVDLRLGVSLEELGREAHLTDWLIEEGNLLGDDGRVWGMPPLCAYLPVQDHASLWSTVVEPARLIVSSKDWFNDDELELLGDCVREALHRQIPVEILAAGNVGDALEATLVSGASAIVVGPHEVKTAKAMIREWDGSSREAVAY